MLDPCDGVSCVLLLPGYSSTGEMLKYAAHASDEPLCHAQWTRLHLAEWLGGSVRSWTLCWPHASAAKLVSTHTLLGTQGFRKRSVTRLQGYHGCQRRMTPGTSKGYYAMSWVWSSSTGMRLRNERYVWATTITSHSLADIR